VAAQDKAALSRASGVGPRLASRIASELRERLVDLPLPGGTSDSLPIVGVSGAAADAVSALINLGYGRSEAHAAIAKAAASLGERAAADALIRSGLRDLAGA
jgi:Holliday junction DNA helicase RuvA